MRQSSKYTAASRVRPTPRWGFTLIELMVVIGIIGILVALLIPAIQYAREAARKVQCRNNLKQLALGVSQHETAFGAYPSNGWGWLWIGEPDRGSGREQPGGWIYQTLPYIEKGSLREIGANLPPGPRRLALAELSQQVVALTQCPSRPAPARCPPDNRLVWRNAEVASRLSRSDYAGNGGDVFTGVHDGPRTLKEGDSRGGVWLGVDDCTGVVRRREPVRARDVLDGLSNTYLIAEKHVCRRHYDGFGDPGYDQSVASGDDWDLVRWTSRAPGKDSDQVLSRRFGSAHTAVFHAAACDGSVHAISYSIDAEVHRHLGNRFDGESVSIDGDTE